MKITIWNENYHEKTHPEVGKIYPDGIHRAIREGLFKLDDSLQIQTATLDQPEHGLTDEVLDETEVLFWWGHAKHQDVSDEIVNKVKRRVIQGMGLVVLHSGHLSKIFVNLMGTSGSLRWREAGERERLWVCNPGHTIAKDLPDRIELEHEEMYGEPFGIPDPEELVFISWFEGGEVFRSGCCWRRGAGRIFYFRPGHETYPIYHNTLIIRVLYNAAKWARPEFMWETAFTCPNVPAEEAPEPIEPSGTSVH